MNRITICHDFECAYLQSISDLMHYGRVTRPRGMETREITPYIVGFDSPRHRLVYNTERNVNIAFMLAECLWIITGQKHVDMVSFYNSKIANYSDDGETFHGAYGPRLRGEEDNVMLPVDQLQAAIDKLKEDPDSRQAICTIFSGQMDYVKTKDVPCTISYQFLLRDNKLELIANMRSNDVILGLSTDAFNFSVIQELVASELDDVELGTYFHVDGSLHIYSTHYERAKSILESPSMMNKPMPEMPKNSLKHITTLSELEKKLRTNEDLGDYDLPEYWEKWLFTFGCYKALKENNIELAEEYVDKIGDDHPFRIFLKRSIKRKKEKRFYDAYNK